MSDPLHRDPLHWRPVATPDGRTLAGRYVVLRSLDPAADADALYAESHPPAADGIWTYLPYGPFPDVAALRLHLDAQAASADPLFYAVVPAAQERPAGVVSYLRITPMHGVIEIGHIWFGASLARTTAATETIYLLARHVFDDLGYRRLEWKCDVLNGRSRAAALRFGFTFEGVFRHHMVIKDRNRDTAWFAITDGEWPSIRPAYETWLAPENFDQEGRQRQGLHRLLTR